MRDQAHLLMRRHGGAASVSWSDALSGAWKKVWVLVLSCDGHLVPPSCLTFWTGALEGTSKAVGHCE